MLLCWGILYPPSGTFLRYVPVSRKLLCPSWCRARRKWSGKVSSSGVKEKDINLAITLKCQSVLEQNGVKVILTRNSDCSLADSNASNKKASDLKKRKALIKESQIKLCSKIYTKTAFLILPHMELRYSIIRKTLTAASGFSYSAQMQNLTGIQNHRKIKANTDYYLLRDNNTPTVIAEVCFLSNPSEAAMITEETIQEKAAFQIAMGIMQFLHSPSFYQQ